jgi:hypothetical protein
VFDRRLRHAKRASSGLIVSETFAKRFFPGKNPVGRTFEEAGEVDQNVGLLAVVGEGMRGTPGLA